MIGHEQLLGLSLKNVCPSLPSILLARMWAWWLELEHASLLDHKGEGAVYEWWWSNKLEGSPGSSWIGSHHSKPELFTSALHLQVKWTSLLLSWVGIWSFLSLKLNLICPQIVWRKYSLGTSNSICSNFLLPKQPTHSWTKWQEGSDLGGWLVGPCFIS